MIYKSPGNDGKRTNHQRVFISHHRSAPSGWFLGKELEQIALDLAAIELERIVALR